MTSRFTAAARRLSRFTAAARRLPRVAAARRLPRVAALAACLLLMSGCRDWSALGGDFGVVVMYAQDMSCVGSCPVTSLPDGFSASATVLVGADPNQDFTPQVVSIIAGGDVTWSWRGGTHSLVSDSKPPAWDATAPQSNGTAGQLFPNAGTYPYHCGQHPTQTGTVIVAP
jgi:plastocyanin